MGGQEKHRRMPPSTAYVSGVCATQKRGYWTMAGARAAAKELKKRGTKGLHGYCPDCNYYHLGHLPEGILRGRVTRREAFRPRKEPA